MGRVKRKLSKLQEYIERDYLYQEDSEKAEEGIHPLHASLMPPRDAKPSTRR